MKPFPKLPTPAPENAGRNYVERKAKQAFARIAKLWTPSGEENETVIATVSRYAFKLINSITGQAYAVEELPIASSQITDSTAAGRALITAADARAQGKALGDVIGQASNPYVSSIAFVGDSITQAVGTDLNWLSSSGYPVWIEILSARKLSMCPASTQMTFGMGGYKSDQIASSLLPAAIASASDSVFIHCGTNDYNYVTSAVSAATIRDMWLAVKAAGKTPIGSSILPVVGNSAKSTWIVATNALLRSYALENNVLFCDWTGGLENVADSNTGVSNTTYLPDNLHPGTDGAMKIAAYAVKYLAYNTTNHGNPFVGLVCKTANPRMMGSSGQPTNFGSPFMPSGATLNGKTLTADPETGGYWFAMDVSAGSATSIMSLQSDLRTDASTLTVSGMVEVEVVSGTFYGVAVRCIAYSPTVNRYCPDQGSITLAPMTSANGKMILKTRPQTIAAGVTHNAIFYFFGTGVIKIRKLGLYQ